MRMTYRRLRLLVVNAEANSLLKLFRRVVANSFIPIYHLDNLVSSKKCAFTLDSFPQQEVSIYCLVHHSDSGLLDEHDNKSLHDMKSLGFNTVLITNSPHVNLGKADIVLKKGKYGRDMSSLRDVARSFLGQDYDLVELFFVNNSIAWKQNGLNRQITQLRRFPINTLIFPTYSKYPRTHVQPYFIYTRLNMVGYRNFAVGFEWIRNWHLRRSIIHLAEYRIFQQLKKRGWTIKVLATYEELLVSENLIRQSKGEELLNVRTHYYNPSQHMWRALSVLGIYTVKKSLIRNNPAGVLNAPETIDKALRIIEDL